MKEVLTKSFWQEVKKTFQDALEGLPPEDKASKSPAAANAEAPSMPDEPHCTETSEKN